VTRRHETRRLTLVEARRYLAQANEFLDAAESELRAERFNAAAGNAVVAVVNAADAVSGYRLGERWTGPHELAGRHVRQAGAEGKQLERALHRTVPFKNRAQYDPRPVSASRARNLVETGRRAVAAANRVASGSAG
jgi:HEPN domain-containing protein